MAQPDKTMNPAEFKRACARLRLSVSASRHALGLSLRQVQRYSSGEQEIPAPVAKLLRLALKLKLSADDLRAL
jgi:DNA-binding transcriptional regulator YiaG